MARRAKVAGGGGRLRRAEERYEGYTVYDNSGRKIGNVDELFVDEDGREEYIGVKTGPLGFGGTTLIPSEIARVNERDGAVEVAEAKDKVRDAPSLEDDEDITREQEDEVRRHFGLEPAEPAAGRAEGEAGTQGEGGRRTKRRRRTVREEVLEEEEEEEEERL